MLENVSISEINNLSINIHLFLGYELGFFQIVVGRELEVNSICYKEGRKEMFYLTTHSTNFRFGYMASDIWLRTILTVRKESRYRHIGYSFRLSTRILLYAPSHGQDSTYHGLCYTSRGVLARTRNSSVGSLHKGSFQRPIAP